MADDLRYKGMGTKSAVFLTIMGWWNGARGNSSRRDSTGRDSTWWNTAWRYGPRWDCAWRDAPLRLLNCSFTSP
jgi:hypothetical protein